jgi:dCTP deaminase
MAFWSGEKLAARLPALLGADFRPHAVKSARYALRVGGEVYVTSSTASGGPRKGVTIRLGENAPFKIPPGQFAFLVTEERVKVPNYAIALISIKTSLKYRGLVNVSGFHVDPGWDGYLKFGIYNAGPQDVHLRRGQDMFLIWYADLDHPTEKIYKNTPAKCGPHIPEEYASNLAGQMYSPQVLAGLIRRLENRLQATWYIFGALLAAVVVVGATNWFESKPKSPPASASPTSMSTVQPPAGTLPPVSTAPAPTGQLNSPASGEASAAKPLPSGHSTSASSAPTADKRKSTDARSQQPETK